MRIICIDEEGRFGGPERRIVNIAYSLKKFGVYTEVWFPIFDSIRFENYLIEKSVACKKLILHRLTLNKFFLVRYILTFPYELFSLAIKLYFAKPDIVHVNGSYQFKSAMASILSRQKFVWHLNDTKMNKLVLCIWQLLAKLSNCSFITAGSAVTDYYLNQNGFRTARFYEIEAPVGDEFFENYESAKYSNVNDCFVIATTTGLQHDKGFFDIIKIALLLNCSNINYKIYVAGITRELGEDLLKKYIPKFSDFEAVVKNIKFYGFVSNVHDFLRSAHMFAFTSYTEASPTAVWEAMASGLPVVTYNVGSVKNYIKSSESGYVVNLHDVRQFVEHIIEIQRNPTLCKKLAKNAKNVAISNFSLKVISEKYLESYNSELNWKLKIL